jgi:hypothetical protein
MAPWGVRTELKFVNGDLVKIAEGVWEPELVDSTRIGIIIDVLDDDSYSYYEILLDCDTAIRLHGVYLRRVYGSADENNL